MKNTIKLLVAASKNTPTALNINTNNKDLSCPYLLPRTDVIYDVIANHINANAIMDEVVDLSIEYEFLDNSSI